MASIVSFFRREPKEKEAKTPVALSKLTASRLQKELREWQTDAPEGCSLRQVDSLTSWTIGIAGPSNSLYVGKTFTLKFQFPDGYPLESPEVVFIGKAPVHPHIYSNGHICLNILYEGWSPAMTVRTTCISLVSMLASNTIKERPEGDKEYSRWYKTSSPKDTPWEFHDDSV